MNISRILVLGPLVMFGEDLDVGVGRDLVDERRVAKAASAINVVDGIVVPDRVVDGTRRLCLLVLASLGTEVAHFDSVDFEGESVKEVIRI